MSTTPRENDSITTGDVTLPVDRFKDLHIQNLEKALDIERKRAEKLVEAIESFQALYHPADKDATEHNLKELFKLAQAYREGGRG